MVFCSKASVKGFAVHGVHLAYVKEFNLSNNIADGNQVYGLFPIVSQQGVVANNEAKNTPFDAALYVGQSKNIVISSNRTHDSLIGIELENSQSTPKSFHLSTSKSFQLA